jgi:UDP-N-acetyl-D-glucosamine/UDP-N-acetyl-D-galactosamine dehydrogenase
MYKIGIVGLGYVGLPLLKFFSKKFNTIGYDINPNRISELKEGQDSTRELAAEDLENLIFSNSLAGLKECNVFIITVPTPILEDKSPDLKPLKSSSLMIGSILKKNDLVIYESTVYPKCTEEVCIPILEKESGLVLNEDFYVGYSPERVVPGDKTRTIDKIMKIVSGSSLEALEIVDHLYSQIIKAGTYRAASIPVAEAAKAIENAQRDLNISFVNELAIIFSKIGIDTTEVIEAASTKWNFHSYKPGLVGGHCIGVDPYYLVHKSREVGYIPEVILSGRNLNESVSDHIVKSVTDKLAEQNAQIIVKNLSCLVLGITFKENCPDVRNTGVYNLVQSLKKSGIRTEIYDPVASKNKVLEEYNLTLKEPREKSYDIVILAVGHDCFKTLNPNEYTKSNGLVYDIKSFYPRENNYIRL